MDLNSKNTRTMRQRTPGYILIPSVMIFIIGTLMMVTPVNFDMEPGILGFFSNTWNQFINTMSSWISLAITVISLIMIFIINSLNQVIENQRFKKLPTEQQQSYLAMSKQNYFKNILRSGRERQSDEEEQSIILDHGFDGITELDNALPQWWLAMFYMGIVFMVVYLLAFSFTDFADPEVEYEEFNTKEQARVDKWIEENDITMAEATNKYLDAQAIAEGKKTFESICATCHRADGGGGIGPNLTDDNWINKTQDSLFYNIYDIIFNGSPTNAQMRAFGQRGELTGLAVEKVASYVYYLNQEEPTIGVNEGGAAPQGDLINEWSQSGEQPPMNLSEPEIPATTPTPDVTTDSATAGQNNN